MENYANPDGSMEIQQTHTQKFDMIEARTPGITYGQYRANKVLALR